MNNEELAQALVEHGYLEGDFVLRSGKRSSFYFDKFRFETQPDVLEPLGRRLAEAVAGARGRCGPPRVPGSRRGRAGRGGIARLAPAVRDRRDEAKEYGTANRIEGAFEEGERVCLIEDVVTSGGALARAVGAVREAGLECRTAICVVDREEGSVDALARVGVRLHPLYRASSLLELRKSAAKPLG